MNRALSIAIAAGFALACAGTQAQDKKGDESKKGAPAKGAGKASKGSAPKMSFFVTSTGSGKGGDLGGLKGADAHCQELAKAAGAGNRTWHAYLSTQTSGGTKGVNARDRIGKGPWYNVKGELIARNLDELHTPAENKISKQTALTEKGESIPGVGDKPVKHDILTGSDSQGRTHQVTDDTTCRNWTSSSDSDRAQVGHSDRTGLSDTAPAHSWNMSHMSAGCSQPALRKTGGDALFYCFATR